MRNLLLAALICAIVLTLSGPVLAEETFISVNGGVFNPSDDYPDDYDPGMAAGLSYIMVDAPMRTGGETVAGDAIYHDAGG